MVEYDIIFKHDLYAPVAQSVEHLTFNQRVRDSSSRRSTKQKEHPCGALFVWCFCVARVPSCVARGIRNIAPPFRRAKQLVISLCKSASAVQNSRRSRSVTSRKRAPLGCLR